MQTHPVSHMFIRTSRLLCRLNQALLLSGVLFQNRKKKTSIVGRLPSVHPGFPLLDTVKRGLFNLLRQGLIAAIRREAPARKKGGGDSWRPAAVPGIRSP